MPRIIVIIRKQQMKIKEKNNIVFLSLLGRKILIANVNPLESSAYFPIQVTTHFSADIFSNKIELKVLNEKGTGYHKHIVFRLY